MEARIHHIAICCRDLKRQLEFYHGLLGFKVLWDMPGREGDTMDLVVGLSGAAAHMVMLTGYGLKLELFEYSSPKARDRGEMRQCDHGYTHFAFSVKDLQGIYDRLYQKGVKFNCPPQKLRDGVSATYMKDPEGNTIELIQYDTAEAEAGSVK